MATAVTSLGGPPIGPDNVAILSVTDAAGGRRRRRLHADRTRTTSTAGGEEEEPAHGDAEGGEGTMARAALYGAAEGGEGTVVARAALTALAIRILATVRSAPGQSVASITNSVQRAATTGALTSNLQVSPLSQAAPATCAAACVWCTGLSLPALALDDRVPFSPPAASSLCL